MIKLEPLGVISIYSMLQEIFVDSKSNLEELANWVVSKTGVCIKRQ